MECTGEAELAFKDVERFISDLTIGKAALDGDDSDSTSNILVGKGESGKRHFFLFLQEPMEKGQTVELKFPSSLGCYIKDEDGAPVGIWRQQIDGIIARLSSDGLRTLSNFISKLVYDKIDNKLGLLANQDGSASGDPHIDLLTNPDELRNLIISRRRVHWAVLRIKERLKAIEEKGGRRDSGNGVSIPDTESNKSILWSPQLVTKLMRHPAWDDSIVRAIEDEVFEELQPELESSGVVSSHCRKKWCPLAKDIFEKFLGCLVKLSTLTDASNSQDALILDLRNLALKFAQTLVGIQSSGTKEEVNKLSLAFEAEDKFQGNLPRAEDVVRMATAQAYQDAVGLCNDAPMFETILPEKLQVVATQLPDKESSVDSVDADAPKPSFARVAFRTIEDVEACKASINHKWYIKYQLVDILDALISTATNLCGVREPFVSQARAAIRQAVKESPGYDLSISSDAVKPSIDIPLALPSKLGASDYKPHSFQLFLGLVWPSLRSAGWRLDAGESPSDISFIPPGQKSSGRRSDKRSRMLKQERTKSRIKLAKAANDIGLGFVPKLTKRFFVKIGEMNAGGMGGSSSVTAKKALDRFLAKIESELSEENQDSHKRAKVVVEQIKTSFDELFPMLLENGEDDSILLDANTSPSEYAGCEYLARLLLVLPSILYQAGLAMRLIDDTTIVIKELADFLAINHEELFDKRFHPESEVYIGDNTVKPVVASRLEKLRLISSNSASEHVELDEAILPEDRPNLTDFVETVMEQVIPCRATQNDIIRKNRRIGVGAIGLVCRHCLGSNGEGRYFFSSIDSITTASTVIEKHIQKCPAVSAEIKDRVVECRSRHAEQRKGLAPGAQAAYFLRLWERLRSSKVKDTAATLLVLEANEDRENLKEDCGGASDEFTDHVSVLKYLSETPLWSEKSEIAEALGQYYDSLEIGGRIYSTDAMPKGFSSEWLLEQVTGSAHTTMG